MCPLLIFFLISENESELVFGLWSSRDPRTSSRGLLGPVPLRPHLLPLDEGHGGVQDVQVPDHVSPQGPDLWRRGE